MRQHHFLSLVQVGLVALVSPFCMSSFAASAETQASSPNKSAYSRIKLNKSVQELGNYGAGVTIAVFDTVAECEHAELSGRCNNWVVDDGETWYYGDHGTHVSGIIAGATVGIAPAANIENYGVFYYEPDGWAGYESLYLAHAAGQGASIVNMSYGSSAFAILPSTIDAIYNGGNPYNMLFTIAAGNSSIVLPDQDVSAYAGNLSWIDSILFVGAYCNNSRVYPCYSDAKNLHAYSNVPGYSCFLVGANCVESYMNRFLVAPGSMYSSVYDGYATLTGTSMAAPVVAGAAALLQSRWQWLKDDPATTAEILLQTAKRIAVPKSLARQIGWTGGKSDPNPIYGFGLLNVRSAMENYGTTTVTTSSGGQFKVNGAAFAGGSTFAGLNRLMPGIVAYDSFGRDFALAELSDFSLRSASRPLLPAAAIAPILDASYLDQLSEARLQWSAGSDGEAFAGTGLGDPGVRLAFDQPLSEQDALHLRFTGAHGVQAELGRDPALMALGYFASSELLTNSLLLGHSTAAAAGQGRGRLFGFVTADLGGGLALDGTTLPDAGAYMPGTQEASLQWSEQQIERRQFGGGLGYWFEPRPDVVAGTYVSGLWQENAFYDLHSSSDFVTSGGQLVNFGMAASEKIGSLDLFGAFELTRLFADDSPAAVQFSDTLLASAQVGARFRDLGWAGDARDSLTVSLSLLPTALSGTGRIDYVAPDPNDPAGRSTIAVSEQFAMAELTGVPVRLGFDYTVAPSDNAQITFSAAGGESEAIVALRFRSRF